MAKPFYSVNGTDILPYLIERGLSWSEEDIDDEDSGRAYDATMYRTVIAKKDKHTLSFRELSLSETRIVTNLFENKYVTVSTNIHPKRAGTAIFEMYNSSRSSAVLYLGDDADDISWGLENISLTER